MGANYVRRLEAALIECAVFSGEDMDGDNTRAPTWPPIEVWAVECVKGLRERYDEALREAPATPTAVVADGLARALGLAESIAKAESYPIEDRVRGVAAEIAMLLLAALDPVQRAGGGEGTTMAPTAAEAVTEREKVEREMLEHTAVIAELARFLADPSDDRDCDCHGDGLDYEGEEWTLCECVLRRIGDLPSSQRAGEPPTPDEAERLARERDEALDLIEKAWNDGPTFKTIPLGDWLRERGRGPARAALDAARAATPDEGTDNA